MKTALLFLLSVVLTAPWAFGQVDSVARAGAQNLTAANITQDLSAQDTIGYGNVAMPWEFFDPVDTISYSPDGKRLTYVRVRNGHLDGLWIKGAGDISGRCLAQGGFDPHWSPRGDLIAYMHGRPVGRDDQGRMHYADASLWVVGPDGRNRRLLSPRLHSHEYNWSPDGSTIAMDATGRAFGKLTNVLMTVDVATRKRAVLDSLVHPALGIESFSWSPDSRMVAYVLFLDIQQQEPELSEDDIKDSEVFVINADGTGRTQLTDTPEVEEYVMWSKDGKRLLAADIDDTLRSIKLGTKQ